MTERGKTHRDFYTKRLAQLEDELAALGSDIETAPREVDRLPLEKAAEKTLAKIEIVERQLIELDAEDSNQGIRDRSLDKRLQKINFTKAKETANSIKDRLNRDGGSILFFLQKSKKQMGHYCLEEVINVIMGDQIIDGRVEGAYRRIPVDLGSAISHYDECEFLMRLASYFNVGASTDLKALSEALRKKIRESIDEGTTIFLEIKSVDDLLGQEAFLDWFVHQFWKPLIDEVMAVSKKYKSKFIVALIADSQILTDCSPAYFCDGEAFDCYKMLELPLPNWTLEDIHLWLNRFHSLSPKLKDKTEEERDRFVRKLHRDSEGTPESICVSLREHFL